MTSAMVEVSTTQWEFAHGRRPSGRGYWLFQMGDQSRLDELFQVPGLVVFSEARRQAVREAVRRGVHRVSVCS